MTCICFLTYSYDLYLFSNLHHSITCICFLVKQVWPGFSLASTCFCTTHQQSLTHTSSHLPAPAVTTHTSSHLPTPAVTHSHQRSPTHTSGHLPTPAVTYPHQQLPTHTSSHLPTPAVTYPYQQSPTHTSSHLPTPAVTYPHQQSPTNPSSHIPTAEVVGWSLLSAYRANHIVKKSVTVVVFFCVCFFRIFVSI